ncbi:hypothetical protein HMN09_00777000 [Mycena chlorophos]|uniref:Uncharacterized protein n=1 Tax=Mycena chlorophos TaxID=658473 RepID=A0A8H6SV60_MYCCL|nr:hypothetical protein HMN09_00777000 [Mycena chlorophos]
MQHLAALYPQSPPPFANDKHVYDVLDSIPHGDVPWQTFSVKYNGLLPEDGPVPPWMLQSYETRSIGRRSAFFKNGKRQYMDFFSGNFVWDKSDKLAADVENHGALLVPIIIGSDKTCASHGTGNTEFYPLYGGIANTHNTVRKGHREAISLLGFFSIPKTDKKHANSLAFRKFRRQLFHSSIARILSDVKPHMTKPKVSRCADRHFRRAIYGIGPDISDYPEQCLVTCVVQGWCPVCLSPPEDLDQHSALRSEKHTQILLDAGYTLRELWDEFGIVGDVIPFTADFPGADIHELISPDLLHQLIKGTFKDHLVDWIVEYIETVNDPPTARAILADIDRRIAVTPPFTGLRNFPTGRNFKQWTGDDSKGLMKVFLPAIAGHVPSQMVQAVAHFLEFCYLVRRSVIDEDVLVRLEVAKAAFQETREIFRVVRPDGFSLPRQHSIDHWIPGIRKWAAPNGLCSSITESKHIKAVKEPWRRSNRHEALGQMLLTNQRLDKLHASRVDFTERGMLDGPSIPFSHPSSGAEEPAADESDSDSDSDSESDDRKVPDPGEAVEGPRYDGEVTLARRYERGVKHNIDAVAVHSGHPHFAVLVREFLYRKLHPHLELPDEEAALPDLTYSRFLTFTSAKADFYAPSDMCEIGGMRRERIRATRSWFNSGPRYDCALVVHDRNAPGLQGFNVARVRMFFSFEHADITYPCALVHWFSVWGDTPDEDTGMWVVTPDWERGQYGRVPAMEVVHLDAMFRNAHLIPVFGKGYVPEHNFTAANSLDAYQSFYVSKFADYHAHETVFLN